MEGREKPDVDPRKQIRLERQAKAFTDLLQFALQMNSLLSDPTYSSDAELGRKAEEAAQQAIHDSYLGVLPFTFLIELPEDNPGVLSKNWEIIANKVFSFEASEVRRIDPDQVDFHNLDTDEWLSIRKHKIDKVIPIFK